MAGRASLVDGMGIDQQRLIDREVIRFQDSEKTACVPFVARRTGLLDHYQDRIRVAIDPDFDHTLPVAALLPFAPKLVPRSTKVSRKPRRNCFQICLLIHPRQHKDFSTRDVLCDGREQPVGTQGKIRLNQRLRHGWMQRVAVGVFFNEGITVAANTANTSCLRPRSELALLIRSAKNFVCDDGQSQRLGMPKLEDQIPRGNHRFRSRGTRRGLRGGFIISWRVIAGGRKVAGPTAGIRKRFERTLGTEYFLDVAFHAFIGIGQIALDVAVCKGWLQGPDFRNRSSGPSVGIRG